MTEEKAAYNKSEIMKNKTLKKQTNTNTCYIAPSKHNHAKQKKERKKQ